MKPRLIKYIYYSGDTTIDCYFFTFHGDDVGLGTCTNGRSYSQFLGYEDGDHLGKKIEWSELNADLQQHIIRRLSQMKHDNNAILVYLGLAIKPPTDLIIDILEIHQVGELIDFLTYNEVEFKEV